MRDGELISLQQALAVFVETAKVQGQAHIKPLHAHIAARLVIEGGFHPDEITPHPPLKVERKRGRDLLVLAPEKMDQGERTVLGGLKTKDIDVVTLKEGIGPVIAVSVKGTGNAFRNLTNRMEEAAGDCTNIHITYPAMVYGFLHVLKATPEGDTEDPNDVAVVANGEVVESIKRYHSAMLGLAGRFGVRNDLTRYEAVTVALVSPDRGKPAEVLSTYPPGDSPLRLEKFFDTLYKVYDIRFVYGAPALESKTRRLEWDPDSPAFESARLAGFAPRTRHEKTQVEAFPAAVPTTTEPYRRVTPREKDKYRTCVPLLTLKAAASGFGDVHTADAQVWVEPHTNRRLRRGMYVAQVVGQSMKPLIQHDDWCLFSAPVEGTRQGRVLLVQHRDIHDPETGGSYTVKRWRSAKEGDGTEGWRHTEIRLEPDNRDFEPIVLKDVIEGELQVIAEFVEVLK